MIPFFLFPCRNCCTDPCTIGTDTFDGSLTQWTVTGSASTSGGLLEMTTGDTAIFTPVPSSADLGVRILTHPLTADSVATVRLIAARSDANNYLFGELSLSSGAGEIRLGQMSGGVETWLTDPETLEDVDAELNERSDLTLCWQPGEVLEGVEVDREGYATQGVGVSWSSPDGVTDPAGSFAEFTTSPAGSTNPLAARRYGFVIPPGSIITAIEVSAHIEHDGMDVDYQDSSVRLNDRTGATVGDNKGTNTSLNNVESIVGWGGPTDDWNAGLTWEDINSDAFGVALIFSNVGSSVGNIRVRGVALKVYFTTPDRTPGVLQLNYTNTAAPNTIQCVTATPVLLDPGTLTGIIVVAGDWDFTEYTLEYLQTEANPTCGACQNCNIQCPCCDDAPPAYVIDFGTGGTLEGERVLSFFGFFPLTDVSPRVCVWFYSEPGDCILMYREIDEGETCQGRLEVLAFPGIYAGRYDTPILDSEDCEEIKTATLGGTPLSGFAASYDLEPLL